MATVTTHPLIVKTPGTCGGRPRIDGHRIRVQDVVSMYYVRGHSPEEILDDFPSLSLVKIHAALAYYHDHREELDREMREEAEFVERFKREHPGNVIDWKEV